MSLIKCKECGKEISNKAEICPNCGYKNRVNSYSTSYSSRIKTGSIVSLIACSLIIILIIGFFVMSNTSTDSNNQSSSDANIEISLTSNSMPFNDFICFVISILLAVVCLIMIILFLANKFKNLRLYKWLLLLIAIAQLICSIISIRALVCCGMIYTIFPLINVIGAIITSTGEIK